MNPLCYNKGAFRAYMKHIFKKAAKHPFLLLFVAAILVVAGFALANSKKTTPPSLVTVERGSVVQEVSVTGKVTPVSNLDLAFERAGRVVRAYVNVGDRVKSSDPLVDLDKSELEAQLLEAKANVVAQQAKLDELVRGPRPEDIQTKSTELNKDKQDLNNEYSTASDVVNDSYVKADDAVRKQVDALFTNDEEPNVQLSFSVSDSQLKINVEVERTQVSQELKAWLAELSKTMPAISALQQARGHLEFIRDFLNDLMQATLNAFSTPADTLSTYRASITTARTNVNTALTNVNNQQQTIASQELIVQTKQDELNKLLAGSDPESVNAQKALLDQARASQALIEAQINKTTLHAPMNGIITRQDAKVGQVVAANSILVGIISAGKLQVEANVPEADVAKLQIGDETNVTLDAYGDSVLFRSKVIKIDPSETVIEGVATYKTTLAFENEDARIKPGMTANLDILTDRKDNVLFIPQRSVFGNNGGRLVRVYLGAGQPAEDRSIIIGLRGSDGNVEVVSGLSEGEQILRMPEE